MTFREKTSALYYAIFGDKTAQISSFKYAREATLLIGLAMLGTAGFYGYRIYRGYQEKAAQKVFGECIHEYEKALMDATLWPNVDQVFKVGYEQHRSSALAPYFLGFRADIMLKQNKKPEALEMMNEMLAAMPAKSSLRGSYAIKRALMRMDMDDQAQAEIGLNELQDLAKATGNPERDQALYYVGLYHWSKNDLAQAKIAWKELVALQDADKDHSSPWAVLVQEKLEQIV